MIISICSIISTSSGFPGRFTVRTASVTIDVKWSASYLTPIHHSYVLGELRAQRRARNVVQELAVVLDVLLRLLSFTLLSHAYSKLVEETKRLRLRKLKSVRQQARMHSLQSHTPLAITSLT